MDPPLIWDILPSLPPETMRDWIFFGILIPSILRITIFAYVYFFNLRKLMPTKDAINAAKLVSELEIKGIKEYVISQIVITLSPIIISVPILFWFEFEKLDFSDLDSFPITRIIGYSLFIAWFLFEVDDSFKTYKKLLKLTNDFENLPDEIKKKSIDEIRRKIPDSDLIRGLIPDDIDIIRWGTGVRMEEPRDLVRVLDWLVTKKKNVKDSVEKSTIVKSVKSATPSIISNPLSKIAQFGREAGNIVMEQIREDIIQPIFQRRAEEIIQQKFNEFRTKSSKVPNKIRTVIRGAFPSVSLFILFLINGIIG
tara:strand:+ start:72 stop:1001 length:930 start_codon:yes stop_codon:yes gene_type:complete